MLDIQAPDDNLAQMIQNYGYPENSSIENNSAYSHLLAHFITKTVPFKFRGIDFSFGLSQGLFSSADIDTGTKLLLKVFSAVLDRVDDEDKPLPVHILDAGCGIGVMGICAAAAIRIMGGAVNVRCQDRSELARLITVYNAVMNHIPSTVLKARAEPLLSGPSSQRWDLIMTNIPAKAGQPVLEDFVTRSLGLLGSQGKVIMVAVQSLADFFRNIINAAGAYIQHEEKGPEHHVFVYTSGNRSIPRLHPVKARPEFLTNYPFYRRAGIDFEAEDILMHIQTVYGAAGFDSQNAAEHTAMALIKKMERRLIPDNIKRLLIHEPGQGFFPCWLHTFLRRFINYSPADTCTNNAPQLTLSGRNILTLEAARHNYNHYADRPCVIVPAADLTLGKEEILKAAAQCTEKENITGHQYGFIIAFPELLAQSSLPRGADQLASLWESISGLLSPKGIFIAGFSSKDAERFDRKKPAGFMRQEDIKRRGFRALAYKKSI